MFDNFFFGENQVNMEKQYYGEIFVPREVSSEATHASFKAKVEKKN